MPTETDSFPIREPDHLIRIHLRFQLEDAGFTVHEQGDVLEIATSPDDDAEATRATGDDGAPSTASAADGHRVARGRGAQ